MSRKVFNIVDHGGALPRKIAPVKYHCVEAANGGRLPGPDVHWLSRHVQIQRA
jgi:hypothetical protein